MVESEAQELSEETMLGAVMFGFESFQPVIKLINELKADAGKEPWEAPVFPPEFDVCTISWPKIYRSDLKPPLKKRTN